MYIPSPYKNTDLEKSKRFIQENSFGTLILKNTLHKPDVRDSENDKEMNQSIVAPLSQVREVLARPLPFEVDIDSDHYIDGTNFETLTAHLGKHYPIYNCFKDGDKALVTFQGPESYTSPTWYDNLEAATWNYIHIQVYGTIERLDTEAYAENELKKYEPLAEKYPKHPGYGRMVGMARRRLKLIKEGDSPCLKELLKVQLYKYEKKMQTDPLLSLEMLGQRFQYLKNYIGAIRVNVNRVEVKDVNGGHQVPDVQSAFKLSQDQNDWSQQNIIKNLKATGYPGSVGVAKAMEVE